jgi:hypothetical protein
MSAAALAEVFNTIDPDVALADELKNFYDDPLGFVMFAYPWGVPGSPLEGEIGPDANQIEFLTSLGEEVRQRGFDGTTPVLPIRMTETSGHGTGKSAMGAWIADWILSTRPHSIGTVTAGTFTQLIDRTWAAIRYWTKLCITAHWFDIQARSIHHKKHPSDWKVLAQTCKEQNAQAFAGQHARTSTSWYLLDEASEVPDKIWETAEGGFTDGEPMIFAWGQPVRNSGEFYVVNFGKKKARWNPRRVDSRTSRFTNHNLIKQWIADYGIDSDFCKVRILGLPPSASELQYIDKARVEAARRRTVSALPDDALVAGFDVSGGGLAWNVIHFRRGLDGKPRDAAGNEIKPIRIPGEHDVDRSQRVGLCAELLRDRRPGRQLAAMFVDSAYGAPIVARLKALGFTNVHEVNFGGASPDIHCLNMRAYMYMKAKEWLLLGAIPDDDELCDQLSVPGYHINNSGKLVMESKESITGRGEKSPDDADSFILTWAMSVAPPKLPRKAQGSSIHVSAFS